MLASTASTACAALGRGLRLELRYDGFSRVVEVHAVGTTKDGSEIMCIWQVRGGSEIDESVGWKIFSLDDTFSAHVIEEKSKAPRDGYLRGDKAMAWIRCQI